MSVVGYRCVVDCFNEKIPGALEFRASMGETRWVLKQLGAGASYNTGDG